MPSSQSANMAYPASSQPPGVMLPLLLQQLGLRQAPPPLRGRWVFASRRLAGFGILVLLAVAAGMRLQSSPCKCPRASGDPCLRSDAIASSNGLRPEVGVHVQASCYTCSTKW